MHQLRLLVLLMLTLLIASAVSAQTTAVRVPDVTGLNVPQAAAALNRAGLRLGAQIAVGWTPDSPLPQDSVSAQSLSPDTEAAFGTAVDLTVLRSANALLIYDDNDITLVNGTGAALDLSQISFNTLDGSVPAAFQAARWGGVLEAGDCGQLWSLSRREPKSLEECTEAMLWATTNDPAQHFWTGGGGVTQFSISQGGIQRGICPVSAVGRCEFFLASSTTAGDATDYVYFAYTADALVILNRSADRWMPLNGLLLNTAPTPNGFPVGPAASSVSPETVLGDVYQLAPGQCLLARLSDADTTTAAVPEPCDVLATYAFAPETQFWARDFYVTSSTDGQTRRCPAPGESGLSLCILPR